MEGIVVCFIINVFFRFAFVEFSSIEEAQNAVEVNKEGIKVGGKTLTVSFSKLKSRTCLYLTAL